MASPKPPDSKLPSWQRVMDRSKRGIRADDAERWLRENDPKYRGPNPKYVNGGVH